MQQLWAPEVGKSWLYGFLRRTPKLSGLIPSGQIAQSPRAQKKWGGTFFFILYA